MINKNYLINGSTTLTAGAVGAYNEFLQYKVQEHQLPWHPLMGQGSDFAAGAIYTALFVMYIHYKEQKHGIELPDWIAPLSAVALSTFGEWTGLMGDTFDPKDIAAYWLGAGLAYAVHRAFVTNSLEEKISAQDI